MEDDESRRSPVHHCGPPEVGRASTECRRSKIFVWLTRCVSAIEPRLFNAGPSRLMLIEDGTPGPMSCESISSPPGVGMFLSEDDNLRFVP
jgi:hypothetical protein